MFPLEHICKKLLSKKLTIFVLFKNLSLSVKNAWTVARLSSISTFACKVYFLLFIFLFFIHIAR